MTRYNSQRTFHLPFITNYLKETDVQNVVSASMSELSSPADPPSNPSHACPVCQETFQSLKKLEKHMKLHPDYKPFTCLTCGKSFRVKGYLKQHMTACMSACEGSTIISNSMATTTATCDPHRKKSHKCILCGKETLCSEIIVTITI